MVSDAGIFGEKKKFVNKVKYPGWRFFFLSQGLVTGIILPYHLFEKMGLKTLASHSYWDSA